MLNEAADVCSLLSLMSNSGFHQIIKEPTRVTQHTRTLIDHIYTTDPDFMLNATVIMTEMSDHYPTAVSYCKRTAGTKKNHTTIKYRSMTQFNEEDFLNELKIVPWNIVEIFDDPNDALGVWQHLFLGSTRQSCPTQE